MLINRSGIKTAAPVAMLTGQRLSVEISKIMFRCLHRGRPRLNIKLSSIRTQKIFFAITFCFEVLTEQKLIYVLPVGRCMLLGALSQLASRTAWKSLAADLYCRTIS